MRFIKHISLLCFLLYLNMVSYAQQTGITTFKGLSTEELIRDVFLKSGCKNVSNFKAINNGLSIGYFEDDSFIFGFQEGVILSSGDVALAEGPNGEIESTFAYAAQSDDPDLNVFAPGSIFDVGGIEFDFVPVGETVTFEYAFGSEEYCEFVGSMFNDVFGFFVSGPGINGPFSNNAINVALVPGTNDFVAINSINHATNAEWYIKNELFEETDECNIPFDPQYPALIEYDGMTKQLTATFDVIPCETYHIRLLVADVGDDILDSGVFLGAKTFDLNGDVRITPRSVGSDEPIGIEGCRNGEFLFERLTSNFNQDQVVYFDINAGSTAESGLDYTAIPDSIIIPAGSASAILSVEVLADALLEGEETIIIEITYPCDCIDPITEVLYLRDNAPFEALPSLVEVCAGQPFNISPVLSEGVAPFTYLWENGSNGNSLNATVQTDTDFSVTVTDFCNDTVVAFINALIQPQPEAVLSGAAFLCDGLDQFLEVSFGGSAPWAFQYTINGSVEGVFSNIADSLYLLPVNEPGLYGLGIFTDANCTGFVSGMVAVEEQEAIFFEVTAASCFDASDGTISWSLPNGIVPASIIWSPAVNDELMPTNLSAGVYEVEVVSIEGCQFNAMVEVPVSPGADPTCRPYKLYVPNGFSPNDDGLNDDFRLYTPPNNNILRVKEMSIFNRWGGMVFQQRDFVPNASMPLWDGTFKQKKAEVGVYAWQVILVLDNGEEAILSGDVTLLR